MGARERRRRRVSGGHERACSVCVRCVLRSGGGAVMSDD